MRVLGIETSCDETSAAVVSSGPRLEAQVVLSQARLHAAFGGVVPEIACRSHVESLTTVIEQTLREAGRSPSELEGIAVAHRPGLIGALLVGVTTAKALAWCWRLPLVGVHHLAAHLEVPRLWPDPECGPAPTPPFLGVVISGGHTDLYHVTGAGRELLGQTQDDAIGEAFDKVATVLGLGYPGGPAVEQQATDGDPHAVPLPRTLLGPDSLDFSFSGLKTAVLYRWCGQNGRGPGPVPGAPRAQDLCASFQAAVGDVLIEKIRRALRQRDLHAVVVGGGVIANRTLRQRLLTELGADGIPVVYPAARFATDNGAMIALLGQRLLESGVRDDLWLDAHPSDG